jgi:hypothetical protein
VWYDEGMSLYENAIDDPTTLSPTPYWEIDYECENPDFAEYFDPVNITRRCMVNMAIDLCQSCPRQTRCLEEAIFYNYENGIWGGTTPEQRQELIEQDEFYSSLSTSENLAQLCKKHDANRGTVGSRLKRDPEMPIRQAVFAPNMAFHPTTIGDTTYPTTKAAADSVGLSRHCLSRRLKSGADPSAPAHVTEPRPVTYSDGRVVASIAEAVRQCGKSRSTVYSRIKRGIDPDAEQTGNRHPITVHNKNYRSELEASRAYGLVNATVHYRIKRGMTPEEALTTPPIDTRKPVMHFDKIYPSTRGAGRECGVSDKTIARWAREGINGWSYYEPE